MHQAQKIQRKLNLIETYNKDPMLSEFKHHFYLRKVYIPRGMTLDQFNVKLYQGFKTEFLMENSIYVVQMANVYQDRQYVDLVIGFRRDQHALRVARQCKIFYSFNRQSKVEVAKGFQLFINQLNQKAQQQKSRSQQLENLSKKESQKIIEQVQKQNRSRSRSRQQKNKRKDLRDRLQSPQKQQKKQISPTLFRISLLLIPNQFNRTQLLTHLKQHINHAEDIVSCQWRKQQGLSCFQLSLKDPQAFHKITEEGIVVNGVRIIAAGNIGKIKQALTQYQFKITKISKQKDNKQDLKNLYAGLINDKIIQQTKYKITFIYNLVKNTYVVSLNKKIINPQRIKIQGWLVESSSFFCLIDRPSLQSDYWYEFIKTRKPQQI